MPGNKGPIGGLTNGGATSLLGQFRDEIVDAASDVASETVSQVAATPKQILEDILGKPTLKSEKSNNGDQGIENLASTAGDDPQQAQKQQQLLMNKQLEDKKKTQAMISLHQQRIQEEITYNQQQDQKAEAEKQQADMAEEQEKKQKEIMQLERKRVTMEDRTKAVHHEMGQEMGKKTH